jgi:hypothetical protein
VSSPARNDHGHLTANQIGRQRGQSIVLKLRPAIFDRDILSFNIAGFVQASGECIGDILCLAGRSGAEITDRRDGRLLCACEERPRGRADKERDELAPPHTNSPQA